MVPASRLTFPALRRFIPSRAVLFAAHFADDASKKPQRGGAFAQRRVRDVEAEKAVDATGIEIPAEEVEAHEKAVATSTAEAAGDVDLTALWEQRTNAATGRTYYFHPTTVQTTWVQPSGGLEVAKLSRRVAAAAIDLSIALGIGVACGMEVAWEMDHIAFQQPFTMFGLVLGFVGRDSIFENGTRSVGKRVMKLEILDLKTGGNLPHPGQNIKRNFWSALNPFLLAAAPSHLALFAVDMGLIGAHMKSRRVGDWIAGTIVVDELPEREARMAHHLEMNKQNDRAEALNTTWKPPPGQLQLWSDGSDDGSSWIFGQERAAKLPTSRTL